MDVDPVAKCIHLIDVEQLASHVQNDLSQVLIIDSRSFLEYNTSHIFGAVNVCCSKIVKRRLQQDKISVKDLLMHTCQCEIEPSQTVIIYDQGSIEYKMLSDDSFVTVLLKKLNMVFESVSFVAGGFLEFQSKYPSLCENRRCSPSSTTLTSLSQPCLPISNQGPTRILPFLYLGSQQDAMNRESLRDYNITYELNVSNTCPKPDFIPDSHFMRIPVNDNYNEKLLPHFPKAFQFLDKVRESGGSVIIYCLAGISRSATVAISYVMRHLKMSSEDSYRYVKSKRASISPNFNFLGQLLEYEKQLYREHILGDYSSECKSAAAFVSTSAESIRNPYQPKKLALKLPRQSFTLMEPLTPTPPDDAKDSIGDKSKSPTTSLAKLTFTSATTSSNIEIKQTYSAMTTRDLEGLLFFD